MNVAACTSESSPAEAGGLSASSLPWNIDRSARMPDSPLNSQQKIPHQNSVQRIYEEWDIPITVHG